MLSRFPIANIILYSPVQNSIICPWKPVRGFRPSISSVAGRVIFRILETVALHQEPSSCCLPEIGNEQSSLVLSFFICLIACPAVFVVLSVDYSSLTSYTCLLLWLMYTASLLLCAVSTNVLVKGWRKKPHRGGCHCRVKEQPAHAGRKNAGTFVAVQFQVYYSRRSRFEPC